MQTSIMVNKDSKAEDEPTALKWVWRAESIDNALHGKSNVSLSRLVDQKDVANDASDYLWYMTK